MKRTNKDLPRLVWNWVWEPQNTRLLTVLALLAVLVNVLGCRMQQLDVQRAEERGREAAYAEMEAQGAPVESLPFNGERTSSGVNELSASAGSERYGACEDEDAIRAETLAAETEERDEYERALKLLCQEVYGLYQVGARRADQMELAAWVAINRVDDPRWPDTLEEVLLQPEQWQGFSEDSPVLQDIYTVCQAALEAYTSGGVRPIAPDYVYMSYEGGKLTARTEFLDSGTCRYIER